MAKNPKLVVDAFVPDALKIGNIVLRPITMGTILVLEKLDCPLTDDNAIAAAKKNKGKFAANLSNDDVARLVFVLTHSAQDSLALLQVSRDVFDRAVYDYLDRIEVRDMPVLGGLITGHFQNAFSTVIGGADAVQKKTESATPGPT